MNDNDGRTLQLAKTLNGTIRNLCGPPEEGVPAAGQRVIPFALVRGTRGYIERIANQVNGCYGQGWYDACAVMLRRLIETLLIEAFEKHGIAAKIKASSGDFLRLEEIIDKALAEPSWNLARNSKVALPRLKKMGDLSAHGRRYNAHLADVEPLLGDIRVVVQEFVYLAGFK